MAARRSTCKRSVPNKARKEYSKVSRTCSWGMRASSAAFCFSLIGELIPALSDDARANVLSTSNVDAESCKLGSVVFNVGPRKRGNSAPPGPWLRVCALLGISESVTLPLRFRCTARTPRLLLLWRHAGHGPQTPLHHLAQAVATLQRQEVLLQAPPRL